MVEVNGQKRVIISFYDITDKKKYQEALKSQNRELEQKVKEETEKRLERERMLMNQSRMASMGEVMSSIAHQWRQPLNVLGIIVQDIEDAYHFDELNPEYINKNIKKAMEHITFLSKTIDDFRSFFKPDNTINEFSPLIITRDILAIIEHQLQVTFINVECFGDESIIIQSYQNEFKQVLLNLINNAKDALSNMNKYKVISIKISQIENKVQILVSDNGVGITEENREKIFDPYFTTKHQSQGTGMGLYVSKTIVESHMRGDLRLVSSEIGNTTFEFILPLNL
jgi:signal transduction histidine kinase